MFGEARDRPKLVLGIAPFPERTERAPRRRSGTGELSPEGRARTQRNPDDFRYTRTFYSMRCSEEKIVLPPVRRPGIFERAFSRSQEELPGHEPNHRIRR